MIETLSICVHGRPIKFGCSKCYFGEIEMSDCHEQKKNIKDLILEYIDNSEKSFKTLEILIKANEEGLIKCFEWIEKLENNISVVHDLVNMEDRITVCDVLNRLTLLESQDKNGYMYQKGQIEALVKRIKLLENSDFDERINDIERIEIEKRLIALENHKNYQTDENRKVSRRMDKLENEHDS